MTSNYIRVLISSPHLYIVVALFPSVKFILRCKIMSRFAINIYSPVNLKKTFSTFFTELSTHLSNIWAVFANHKMHIKHIFICVREINYQ